MYSGMAVENAVYSLSWLYIIYILHTCVRVYSKLIIIIRCNFN